MTVYRYIVLTDYGQSNKFQPQEKGESIMKDDQDLQSFSIEDRSSYNSLKDFTSLDAWERCREVKLYFYSDILPRLPKRERFNLDIQIRKAAVSITANIAEGYGRYYYKEGVKFYRISRASLYELKDHLISCLDLHYISDLEYENGLKRIEVAKVVLNCFIRFVQKKSKV